MLLIIYVFASAFILAFMALPVLISILTKWQLLDVGGRRKIHKGFVPSMGGIAIFLGFLTAIVFWLPVSYWVTYKFLLCACCIIFLTGLCDDAIKLTPINKLIPQILAAMMIIWNGGNDANSIRIMSFYGFLGIYELPLWVSYAATLFVIIALTNAFNLIDGLNGLAGLLGLLSFSLIAMWFFCVGTDFNHGIILGLFTVALIGGIVAFLCFNWHPASIFMGDTGSLLLGFFLSVSIIKFFSINGDPNFVSYFKLKAPVSMAIALSIIPLFDTSRIFLLRISQKRSPFSPDKLHVHHLLIRMGLNHAQVTIILGALYLCFVGLILFLTRYFTDNILVPFIIFICVCLHFILRKTVYFVFDRRRSNLREILVKKT